MATKIWIGGASGAAGDWSNAANWSPSGVPTTGDDVLIQGPQCANQDINAGLDQSAVLLASLTVYKNFEGLIGTTSAYLQVGASVAYIGVPTGAAGESGSKRIKINFGTDAVECSVYATASSSEDADLEPCRLLSSDASGATNTLNVLGGTVGIATTDPSEVSDWTTITVAQQQNQQSKLHIGRACTLTSINIQAGTVINLGANVTTLTMNGGTYTAYEDGAHATVNQKGGTCYYNSDGAITTANISGTLDLTRDARAKTITTLNVYPNGAVLIDNGVAGSITLTNGIQLQGGADNSNTRLSWPAGAKITLAYA